MEFIWIIGLFLTVIFILILCIYSSRREDIVLHEKEIKLYGITTGALENLKTYEYDKVPMFRDLPFKDNYFLASYVASMYGIGKSENISILLLTWLKNDIIEIIYEDNKMKKIKLKKEPTDELELNFYYMMKNAATDDILDNQEFKYYCKENYEKIKNWLSNISYKKSLEILSDRDFVNIKYNNKGAFKSNYEFIATDELNNKALELAGLKKFLHELSLINEKNPIEVKLWRDYLIYAEIFGIAYEVQDVLSKYYGINIEEFINMKTLKEYTTSIVLNSISNVESINRLTDFTITNMNLSDYYTNPNNISRARDYSFGGGGFSSGGGGGGSFGGGGGGGGFR